jgi:AraC family transcriptional regulator, positive regulator of tynA and feaB
VDTYKESGLIARTGAAAWSDLYPAPLDHAGLAAAERVRQDLELHLGDLGPLRITRLLSGNSTIHRTRARVADTSSRTYSLVLQIQGSGTLSQYGNEAQLDHGDLALYDNAAPHSHLLGARSEIIVLRVPAQLLREHLPSAEQFCGRRLLATDGITCATTALVSSLCQQLEAGLPDRVQERLARQVVEMVATSYTLAFDALMPASASVGTRHARAKLYIEQNLQDPELGPRSIASCLKVSSRYLRMIFAAANESVSTYILRRRLEECARQLADVRWRNRSICEIAFGWGFNSAPHFSRSFRELYGKTPREYRLQHVDEQPPQRLRTLATNR